MKKGQRKRRQIKKYLLDPGNRALMMAALETATRQLRLEDMSFVLDRLLAEDYSVDVIKGRIDPTKIGALGHSFGAFTTLSLLGQRFDGAFVHDYHIIGRTSNTGLCTPANGKSLFSHMMQWAIMTEPVIFF